MSLKDDWQKMGLAQFELGEQATRGMTRAAQDGFGAQLARISELATPSVSALSAMSMPTLPSAAYRFRHPEERAADCFMEGLRQCAEDLENGLQENQELQMFCYHGPEKLRVLEVSMPSENVVSLQCLNLDGEETHVTGHMHSVTFSYLIHTIVPPEVKRPIGFTMPSEGE
jgi:hypothetical protein